MSTKAQLKQRSNGEVIVDSVGPHQVRCCEGYLVIPIWVPGATGAKPGSCTSMLGRCHVKVEMGCSPWDGGHKGSIRKAIVSGRGAITVREYPVSLSLQQASMATRNKPHSPLLTALHQRPRAVLCLITDISWHVGCEKPRTM
eukprot:1147095-Pelagomonas_calceolata.AAC.1